MQTNELRETKLKCEWNELVFKFDQNREFEKYKLNRVLSQPDVSIMNIKKQKIELRKKVLSDRDQMSTADITRASAVISSEIFDLEPFKDARVIAAYMSFGSEFLTDGFVDESLRLGKILVLPRVDKVSGSLSFHKWNGEINQLSEGRWGIREPNPLICELIQVSMIDFVLVPGVAFTNDGFRLGYGGGYYDRTLEGLRARGPVLAIGFAFNAQQADALPLEPTDQPLDMIVTEDRIVPLSH